MGRIPSVQAVFVLLVQERMDGRSKRLILGGFMTLRVSKSVSERFWSKVCILHPSDCWEWQAAKFCNGYGVFRLDGKNFRAHRLSWVLEYGDIPEGLSVLHSCDNPSCVNPHHLWLGTQLDNLRDSDCKGRQTSWNERRTQSYCIHGHIFDFKNTRIRPNGSRECRVCHREAMRKRSRIVRTRADMNSLTANFSAIPVDPYYLMAAAEARCEKLYGRPTLWVGV